MKYTNSRSGGALIAMALFFAVIGILVGLGRLKAYENQVERRVERTYQLEKVLAVRSVETLIRDKGQFVTDNNDVEVYPVFSNYYPTAASGETLLCQAVPTEYRERQHSFTNWCRFPSSRNAMPLIKPNTIEGEANFVDFSVDNPVSNVVYWGGVYTNTVDSWLKSDRGYLYGMRLKDAQRVKGANKTRLYIIGSDADDAMLTGSDYRHQLTRLPWILLENEVNVALTNQTTIRHLHIRGKPTEGVYPERRASNMIFTGLEKLSSEHEYGLLLSKNLVVAYARDDKRNLFFTERYDLSEVDEGFTNDFKNVWVLIENEFATHDEVLPLLSADQLPLTNLTMKVQMFSIKEPTTYSISIVNTRITNQVMAASQVMTWLFQTGFPDQGNRGKHCLLDTFGGEPVSLKKERRGELKD